MKKSYSEEIRRAEAALFATKDTAIWKEPGRVVASGINGMVAGFSVSIAMIGLLPTVLYYYADEKKRRKVLELIARMSNTTAIDMISNIRVHPDSKAIRQQIVDDAIGLKYIIRTYQQE